MGLDIEELTRDAQELLVLEQVSGRQTRHVDLRFYATRDSLSTGVINRKWHSPQKQLKIPRLLPHCTNHVRLTERKGI